MNKPDKETLRNFFLNKRKKLSNNKILRKSQRIAQKILGLEETQGRNNISIYIPINNEVETKSIIYNLLERRKTILVPCYFKKDKEYHFAEFTNWQDLEKGPRGILQPKNQEIIDSSKIEVAILPGLAFSKNGVRLGYGKGVFDRLLSKTNALKIGLAYEFQITDDIPREEHDLLMDFLVTEKTIYSMDATFG